MNRYDNVRYNGILLSDICDVEDIRIPVLPSRTISTINIGSRDGEIYNGKKYDALEIEVDILIDCDTKEDCQNRLRELRKTFDVDEPKPFYINEDRFILAISKDKIDKDPVAFHSYEATIKLFCPDPFFYSNVIKNKVSFDKSIQVINKGNRPTPPIMQICFFHDAYFTQIEKEETGEKILVGKYPSLELLSSAKKSTNVLYDHNTTTTNWIDSSSSIDSNRIGGGNLAISKSGHGVMIGSLPSGGDAIWKGTCHRQSLDHSVDEFKLTVNMRHNSSGINGDPATPKYQDDEETIKSGKKTTYWEVTSNSLNVRSSASVKNNDNIVKPALTKGDKITNGTEKNGYVKWTRDGKTVYCKIIDSRYNVQCLNKVIQDSTETEVQCNYVTIKKTAIRVTYDKNSKNQFTIPVGECIRIRTDKKYGVEGQENAYYKLAKKYKDANGNKYDGYVLVNNLAKASSVVFEYDDSDNIETADDKTGIIELYGFDINGKQLFKCGMYDDNPYYEYTYPLCRIGNEIVLEDTEKVPEPNKKMTVTEKDGKQVITISNKLSGKFGSWSDFYGKYIITREKVDKEYVWNIELQKINYNTGKIIKTHKVRNKKNKEFPTEKLAYVVLYMGTSGTLEKSVGMSCGFVGVDEINAKENTADKNVYYFNAGDVLEVDCENHTCYLNDVECNNLVDIGSRYFNLELGENNIKVNTNDDKIIFLTTYREKWLGE